MNPPRQYPKEAIQMTAELISGNPDAQKWLQTNNYPELILLAYAVDGNDNALLELTHKKYVDLTAFVHAVLDDKRAFNYLAENRKFTWAATVRVTYKDRGAEAWLRKHQLGHFADLGIAIRKNEENEQAQDIMGLGKDIIRWITQPFRKKNA